jgi:quercetin dioxygenase-like cupin family protein
MVFAHAATVGPCAYDGLMQPGEVVHLSESASKRAQGALSTRTLIHPEHYAEPMTLDAYEVSGTIDSRTDERCDTLAYVLQGTGTLLTGNAEHGLSVGYAFQVHAAHAWSISGAHDLVLLVFGVPAPVSPWGAYLAAPISTVVDVATLGAQSANAATGDRQYEVLFDRSRGSRGATMFVGFIPTSGAPEHYHLYDEICVIVRGSGALHAGGRTQPLRIGSSFHVAPRFLHALENPNTEDLWVLGVFRPEGSAAAAFYPDGTPAPNNED